MYVVFYNKLFIFIYLLLRSHRIYLLLFSTFICFFHLFASSTFSPMLLASTQWRDSSMDQPSYTSSESAFSAPSFLSRYQVERTQPGSFFFYRFLLFLLSCSVLSLLAALSLALSFSVLWPTCVSTSLEGHWI